MFQLQRILDIFQKYYYTPPIMLITELVAFIIALIYARKSTVGKIFIFYIGFDLLLLIINLVVAGLGLNWQYQLVRYTNSAVALIELLSYYYFFSKILISRKAIIAMRILLLLFLALIITFSITRFSFITNRFKYVADIIGGIEFFFLLPPCLIYFSQLLKSTSTINLFERPSFWIVTGIFFYSVVSIPYYLIEYFLTDNYKSFNAIFASLFFFLPFTINFSFLIKAFLCKRPLTI